MLHHIPHDDEENLYEGGGVEYTFDQETATRHGMTGHYYRWTFLPTGAVGEGLVFVRGCFFAFEALLGHWNRSACWHYDAV
jgi:hypothetical protein